MRKPKFKEVVAALLNAAPFAIAPRYTDYAQCIPASIAGSIALSRFDVKAKVLPCAVMLHHETNEDLVMAIGFTSRQLYDRFIKNGPDAPSFEEWSASTCNQIPDHPEPMHMAIDAQRRDERALIDLTVGQLRRLAPEPKAVPLHVAMFEPGWPGFQRNEWIGRYFKCPHGAERIAKVEADAKNNAPHLSGFVEDLTDLIKLSLSLGNDEDAFFEEIERGNPQVFAAAFERIKSVSSNSP